MPGSDYSSKLFLLLIVLSPTLFKTLEAVFGLAVGVLRISRALGAARLTYLLKRPRQDCNGEHRPRLGLLRLEEM